MSDADSSVISRKIGRVSVGRSPIAQINRVAETLAGILDDRLHGLVGCATTSLLLDCEVRRLSGVLEDLPAPSMMTVIDVAGCGGKALATLENDLVFHVVDLRMGGDPDAAPSPAARAPTDIDRAVCRPFVELLLDCLAEALRRGLEAPASPGLAFGRFERNPAMIRIAPENADVLTLNLSVEFGGAARNGALDLIIPLSVLDHFVSGAKTAPPAPQTLQQNDVWSRRMTRAAADSRLRLTSVLHRCEISAQELKRLVPGDVLPIPAAAAAEIALRMSPGAPAVASGRLGAFEGRKALKLTSPPDSAALEQIARVIGAK